MNKPLPIYVNRVNPNDDFVIFIEWLCEDLSLVEKDTPIALVETTKAVFEVVAPERGYVVQLAKKGDNVAFTESIGFISDSVESDELKIIYESQYVLKSTSIPSGLTNPKVTRKAAKLMKMNGLSMNNFKQNHKIKAEDVLDLINKNETVSTQTTNAKKFEIMYLEKASAEIIYSKVTKQIPYSDLVDTCKKLSTDCNEITISDILLYSISRSLEKFNLLNSYYLNDQLVTYSNINIGFAMNIDKGLKVPVINSIDTLGVCEISQLKFDLALKYMRNELSVEDQTGGTFTVTDLSSQGVSDFNPLVFLKQSATLGICSKDISSNFFNIVLGFDHKVVDGMYAANFLTHISETAFTL